MDIRTVGNDFEVKASERKEELKSSHKKSSKPSIAAEWLSDKNQVDLFYSKLADVGASWGQVAAGLAAVGAATAATIAVTSAAANNAGNNRAAGNRAAGGSNQLSAVITNLDLSDSKISEMSIDDLLKIRESK